MIPVTLIGILIAVNAQSVFAITIIGLLIRSADRTLRETPPADPIPQSYAHQPQWYPRHVGFDFFPIYPISQPSAKLFYRDIVGRE